MGIPLSNNIGAVNDDTMGQAVSQYLGQVNLTPVNGEGIAIPSAIMRILSR